MSIKFKHKATIAVCSILGLGSLGIGTALAQVSPGPSPTPNPSVQAPPAVTPAPAAPADAGPDTETGAAAEKPEAPEAGGANHQDPDGVNVDYTPPGEAPEAG
jgi:hypothetical protein